MSGLPLPSGERAGVRGRVRDAKGRPKGAGLAAGETERQRTPKQPDPEQSEGARQRNNLVKTHDTVGQSNQPYTPPIRYAAPIAAFAAFPPEHLPLPLWVL
jgi:hypothetical protein